MPSVRASGYLRTDVAKMRDIVMQVNNIASSEATHAAQVTELVLRRSGCGVKHTGN